MKLQLKGVKVYDELSEETICFTAELHVDGKKLATVRNDGCGGCTNVYFTESVRSNPVQTLIQYADENPVVYKFDWGTYVCNKVEDHVDRLLDQRLEKKIKGGAR